MVLLDILAMVLFLFLLYMLLSQVIVPAMYSLPLFPMFRTSKLKSEVVGLRDEVHDLEEKAEALAKLKKLRADHSKLTKEIADLEEVHGPADQPAADQTQPSKE